MNAHSLTASLMVEALTGKQAEALSFTGKAELLLMLRETLDRNADAEPASEEAFSTCMEAEAIKAELRSRGVIVAWDGEEITSDDDPLDLSYEREASAGDRKFQMMKEGA